MPDSLNPFPDPISGLADLRKEKKGIDWLFLLACIAVFGFSLYIYAWQFQFVATDMHVHATIASEFNFANLHTITSRTAYPLWHLCVSILFKLGIPLIWASAIVCASAKTIGMWLAWLLLRIICRGQVHRSILTLFAFLIMFVTAIRIPEVNAKVYRGVGSPSVWHNPTQIAVTVSMFLCVPYLAHCWYDFLRRLPHDKERALLRPHQVLILAVLLMFSLSCKPTFMQALIPAAAIFFLMMWIRYPKNSRFFFQIILAFLPAVLYFLLQYLYFTGVVVEFTSGVDFGATPESVWLAIRSMLMMAAFPLFALFCCNRKELLRDKMLALTLLMAGISVLEAMFFRETGLRQGHGNFNWASMSVALMLWVLMTGHFLRSYALFLKSARRAWRRWIAFGVGFALIVWHVGSGGYYLYFLLSSGSSF